MIGQCERALICLGIFRLTPALQMSTSGGKSGGAPAASLRVGAPTRGTLAASHFRFPGRPGHEHTTLTRPTHNTGGVNLQPPSAAGRQVVDLPIPNAGAYLYSDFAGTPMCHSVLNLGGASAYIVTVSVVFSW